MSLKAMEPEYIPLDLKKIDFTKNRIVVDWFTFSLKNIKTFDEAVELLGMQDVNFESIIGGKFMYRYNCKYEFNGVKIFTYQDNATFLPLVGAGERDENGYLKDIGVLVEMTGTGCRTYETYSDLVPSMYSDTDYLWRNLFGYISNHKDVSNVNRLDLAYDDFLGFLNLDKIVDDVKSFNYVTKFRALPSYICTPIPFHKGISAYNSYTVNFGSRKSRTFIRIYDKRYEQKALDICEHWVRCEIQLRAERASAAVEALVKEYDINAETGELIEVPAMPVSELYFLILNNYLRFIVPSDTDSNKWRWKMSEHWQAFSTSVTEYRISLFTTPGTEYTANRLNRYVEKQCVGVVYTYIKLHGVDNLVKICNDYYNRLAVKYRTILALEDVPCQKINLDDFGQE